MDSTRSGGVSSWLARKSINQRLSLLMVSVFLASAILVATIGVGSFVSLNMTERNDQASTQALKAALLEKDFASLERDVFRHSLLRTEDTKQGLEGNIADLKTSIDETKAKLDPQSAKAAEKVSANADSYVATVNGVLLRGSVDQQGETEISAIGDEVDGAIEAIREPAIAAAQEVAARQKMIVALVMIVSVVVVAFTALFTMLLTRGIKRAVGAELESITGSITSIAQGEFNEHIDFTERTDQLGELARAAVQLRETSRAKEAADQAMITMAQKVGESLRAMAAGDLTVQLSDLGSDYEGLRHDFNQAISQLDQAMGSVASAAQDIRTGAGEISQAASDLAVRTEHHASELALAAESVNDLTLAIQDSASLAATANGGVLEAVAEARDGGEVVGKAVSAMANIEKTSAEISQIINVIDGIAFQTNLLALNAGVEAARAGDAGKGFAVVANEVRALAQRSADAAKDIKALINSNGAEVTEGAKMVRQAGEALDVISSRINEITGLVTQIASTANEQSAKLADVNAAMRKMDIVTQQNAAMVEESTAAAHSLLQQADHLTSNTDRFSCTSEIGRVGTSAAAGVSRTRPAPAPKARAPKTIAAPRASYSGNLALVPSSSPEVEDWSDF